LYTAVAIILPGIFIKVLRGGNVEKGLRLMVICLVVLALIGIYFTGFLLPEKKYSKGESSDISLGESFKSVMKDKNFIFYLIGFFLFFFSCAVTYF
jgi:GPH family glycoside/pentoside/hexuronide:cation symporter